MGTRKSRTTAGLQIVLTSTMYHNGYTRHGTLPAYTTSLAWSLPYAQVVHMLIHSYGYELS